MEITYAPRLSVYSAHTRNVATASFTGSDIGMPGGIRARLPCSSLARNSHRSSSDHDEYLPMPR